MPGHGHGFVTQPRVTRDLGDGDFLVEGVKFHMMGAWVLDFEILGTLGPDAVRFDVELRP